VLRRRRRSSARPLLAATAAVVALAGVSIPAAAAAAEADLGDIGFGAVVVDNAPEHVLVSGPTANVVDVLSFSGELIASIPNIDGARGMVIKGHTLFVAESTAGAVAEINLKTLAVAKSPLVTGLHNPRWLAVTGGALWITTGSGHGWGGLATVNLASHELRQFEEDAYYEPDLATTRADHNELFVASDGVSPGSIYRLNVSSGAPVVTMSGTGLNQENIEGLVVSPSGARVIPASGWPYDFEELSADTLKPDGIVYPGEAYPAAVAVSGRRSNLLATGLFATRGPDILVDPIGGTTPIFEATTYSSGETHSIAPHGLALSANGKALFAAHFSDVYEDETWLSVFEVPAG
jgi:hypothetical protein